MTQHIVFLDRASLLASVRAPAFAHTWQDFEQTTSEQVISRIRDAGIVVTNKVKLSGEVLAQTPSVKMIAVAATGTDNVELAYCRQLASSFPISATTPCIPCRSMCSC